ncbi:MAG: helix-turn-helix transcriptional regulator [Bdellovibrionales bacterium]|nr:helix-turn-helix domain-containing protein [Bdellovibrionales bacterium]NQZ17647.1 helix-turn-helix transcriptional regulator [Bdellovibrionales bacterium]
MTTELNKKSEALIDALKQEVGPTTIARLLKHYRDSFELTQSDMGKKLGITKQHVCDLEKGRRLISVEMASKIAKKLKEPIDYWVSVSLQDQVNKAKLKLKVSVEKAG